MSQLFGPRADTALRLGIVLAVLGVAGGAWAWYGWKSSGAAAGRDLLVAQPVPFSHAHHVGGLGIDCRYCHQTVETAAFAGLPPTETCLNCHAQLWTTAPLLEPVRVSWRTGRRLQWNRVHDVADFVYFDHAIHLAKGIGCVSCHGRVDEMPLTARGRRLAMRDCLDCHRDPVPQVAPRERLFDPTWQPGPDQRAAGARLARSYGIRTEGLTHCSACHR